MRQRRDRSAEPNVPRLVRYASEISELALLNRYPESRRMVTMVFNPATGEHRSSPVTGTRSLSSGAGQRARELTVLGKLGVAIN